MFLGISQILSGTPESFPGTLKHFLGISIAPRTSSILVRAWVLAKLDFEKPDRPNPH
jgi:hypothetical protein